MRWWLYRLVLALLFLGACCKAGHAVDTATPTSSPTPTATATSTLTVTPTPVSSNDCCECLLGCAAPAPHNGQLSCGNCTVVPNAICFGSEDVDFHCLVRTATPNPTCGSDVLECPGFGGTPSVTPTGPTRTSTPVLTPTPTPTKQVCCNCPGSNCVAPATPGDDTSCPTPCTAGSGVCALVPATGTVTPTITPTANPDACLGTLQHSLFGATCTEDSIIGTQSWTGPGSPCGGNCGTNAVCFGNAPSYVTHYIRFDHWNLTIPSGRTIFGVKIGIAVGINGGDTTGQTARDYDMRLRLPPGVYGLQNKALLGTYAPCNTNNVCQENFYGNFADTWGETLTPTVLNDPNFGFALAEQALGPSCQFGCPDLSMGCSELFVCYSNP